MVVPRLAWVKQRAIDQKANKWRRVALSKEANRKNVAMIILFRLKLHSKSRSLFLYLGEIFLRLFVLAIKEYS
jgi:hypothetical protein